MIKDKSQGSTMLKAWQIVYYFIRNLLPSSFKEF